VSEESANDTGHARKSEAAFRTISEVGKLLDVPLHVLRFWESKFSQVRPLKRGGGRRYYRPEDVVLLQRIRDLLYRDGMTIKGVQKLFRNHGVKTVVSGDTGPNSSINSEVAQPKGKADPRENQALQQDLTEMRDILRTAMSSQR